MLSDSFPDAEIGLVEALLTKLQHLVVARSLSAIHNNRVIVQVMNTGPLPLTLYKGTKLATYTPREHILLIDQPSQAEDIPRANPIEAVNISDQLTSE